MLFVLPGFLVYLYSGASVFTAAQKSHPLMRTFVMCFSNGCQNPNNIYWKPATDTRWNTRPRSWWQDRLWILMVENFWNILTSSHCRKKHRVGVVCLLQWCAFLFTDLLYCLLHNVTFTSRVLWSGKDFPNMLPKVSSYGQFDNCGEGPSDNSHKKYFCPSSLNISWLRCIKSICWRTGEVLKYLLQEYAQNVKLMESLPGPRGVFFLPLRLWN